MMKERWKQKTWLIDLDGTMYRGSCLLYTSHVMNDVPMGKISCKPGPLTARVSELYFDVIAKGAHGAMPNLGTDALLAASTFVLQLQHIVSRAIDPTHSAAVSYTHLIEKDLRWCK